MNSTNKKAKLGFLSDCLEAESKSQAIWNVQTSSNIELRQHMSYTRFTQVEDNLFGLVIEKSYEDKLRKVLALYSREKRLIVSRFYIIANVAIDSFPGKNRKRKICFPLIYFPASLSSRGVGAKPCIVPNLERGTINPAAIQFFSHFDVDASETLEQILELVINNHQNLLSDKESVSSSDIFYKLFNEFKERIKSNDVFAHNLDKLDLESNLKSIEENEVKFSYNSLVYISRKKASAQGSLFELQKIIKSRYSSPPLDTILKLSESSNSNLVKTPLWQRLFRKRDDLNLPLPVVLNNSQSKIISNAAEQNLSVVVGPPGTGKSFTIASLALKEFTRGKSVLVVSQNQHAVDVVRKKLINGFGIDSDLTVLGSDDGLSRDAKQQIVDFCNGFRSTSNQKKTGTGFDSKKYFSNIKKLDRMIFERRAKERSFLSSCNQHVDTKIEAVKKSFFSWLSSSDLKPEKNNLLLSEQFCDLEERDEDINILTAQLVNLHYQRKAKKIRSNRRAIACLREFAKSLTAKSGYYQERYYQSIDFSHVLEAVPFWFSSLSSLHRLLPLKEELFDIVIIDEATQCNVSSCLPAFYRAKRAVVVGDPKQLNHVSFVSYDTQQALFDKYSLNSGEFNSDFRNNSVLDYALAAIDPVISSAQLDEHFRSHPQIIEYSNQEFYGNTLKIMTARPNRLKQVVELKRVNGKRVKGVNVIEAQSIIDMVERLIKEQKHLPESNVQTIGVLSFFSDQAKYIEKKIFNQLSLLQLRRHNVRVGTPFSFQGEERDHMILSCCVDANTASASYNYLNRDDVFNVAITRSRDFQTIYLSCDPYEIKSDSKLKNYLKYCQQDVSIKYNTQLTSRDSFQDEIYIWLQGQGMTAYRNYNVAGINIDLMAVYEDRALAIDLVGFEGQLKGVLSLTQFKLLARAGLKSFLLPYDEWRNNREELLENLLLQIGALTKNEKQKISDIGIFNDEDENFISVLTNGISINKLNSLFVRNNELRASKQITNFLQRYEQFEKLMHLCFTPSELTFKRYKNAFQALLKDGILKLKQVSIFSELSMSLLEQQKELFNKPDQMGDEYEDIFAARSDMVDEQKNKIHQLLNVNESALLQMDKTCLKLNKLYESADDLALSPHDILNELTQKIDLYKDAIVKNDNI